MRNGRGSDNESLRNGRTAKKRNKKGLPRGIVRVVKVKITIIKWNKRKYIKWKIDNKLWFSQIVISIVHRFPTSIDSIWVKLRNCSFKSYFLAPVLKFFQNIKYLSALKWLLFYLSPCTYFNEGVDFICCFFTKIKIKVALLKSFF